MKPSQTDRVLALLRSRGAQGLNVAELQELPTADGLAPVLRLAARVRQLREAGFTISSHREKNGTSTYVLSEPGVERALSEAEDPRSTMQADPGSVPSTEGVRSAAPAEPQGLFDTSGFGRGDYRDTERAA